MKAVFISHVRAALITLGHNCQNYAGHSFRNRSGHHSGASWVGGLSDLVIEQVEQRCIPPLYPYPKGSGGQLFQKPSKNPSRGNWPLRCQETDG